MRMLACFALGSPPDSSQQAEIPYSQSSVLTEPRNLSQVQDPTPVCVCTGILALVNVDMSATEAECAPCRSARSLGNGVCVTSPHSLRQQPTRDSAFAHPARTMLHLSALRCVRHSRFGWSRAIGSRAPPQGLRRSSPHLL
eukprot:3939710-Rhodomonas_salina.2